MSADDDDSKPAWWGEEDKEKQQHSARKSLMQRLAGASTKKSGSPGAAEPWWEDSGEEEEKREIQPPSDDDGTIETGAVAPAVEPTPASSPISGSEKENTATEAGAGAKKKKKKKRKKKKKVKGVKDKDADAANQPAWWGGNGEGGDDNEIEGNAGTTATATAAAATADSPTKAPSTITPSDDSVSGAKALDGEANPPASEEPTLSNEPKTSDPQATAVVEKESSEEGVSVDPSSAQQPSHVETDEGSKSVDKANVGPGEADVTDTVLEEAGAAKKIGAEEKNETEKNVATDDDAGVPEWWDEGKKQKQKQKQKGGKKERISVLQRIGLAKAPVKAETKMNVDGEKGGDKAEAPLPPVPMSPRSVADSGGPDDHVKADGGALETDSARSSEWEAIDDSANTTARSETVASTGTEEVAAEGVAAQPSTAVAAIAEEEDTKQQSGGVAGDRMNAGEEGEENNDLPAWWDEEKKSKKPSKERKSVFEKIGGLAKGTGGSRSPRGEKGDPADEGAVTEVDSPAPQMADKSEVDVGAVTGTEDETAADVSSTRPSEDAGTSKDAGSVVAIQVPSASVPSITDDDGAKTDKGKEDVPEWWGSGKDKTKKKERKSVFEKIGGLAKGAGSQREKKDDSSWWQVGAEEPLTDDVDAISAPKEDATMPPSAAPSILTGDDVSPGTDINLAPSKDGEATGTNQSQPSDNDTKDKVADTGDTVTVAGHEEGGGANVIVATTVDSNETTNAPAASTPSAGDDETDKTPGGSSGQGDSHVEDTGEPEWWGDEKKKKDRKSVFEKIGLAKGGPPKDKRSDSTTKVASADSAPPQSVEKVTVSTQVGQTEVEEGTTPSSTPPDNAPTAGRKLGSSSDPSADEEKNATSGDASVPAWWDDGQNTKKERKSVFERIGLAKGTHRSKEDRDSKDDEIGAAAVVSAAAMEPPSAISSGSTEKEPKQDAETNTGQISEKNASSDTSPQEADKPPDAKEGGVSQNEGDSPQTPSETVASSKQQDEHGTESEESTEKPKQRKSIQGSFYLSSSQQDAVGEHAKELLDDSHSADENARASEDDSVPAWWDENDKKEKKRISVFGLLRKQNRRETSESPAIKRTKEDTSPTETAADSGAPQSIMESDTSGKGAAPSTDAIRSGSSEKQVAPAQVSAAIDAEAKMGAAIEESGVAEAAASPEPLASDKAAPVGDVPEKETVTDKGEDSDAPAWWGNMEASNQKEKKTNKSDRKSVFELIGLKKSADSAEKRRSDKPKEGDPAWWSSDVANHAADVPGSEIASSASAESEADADADAGEPMPMSDTKPGVKRDTGVSGSSVLSGHITKTDSKTADTKDNEVAIDATAPSVPVTKDGNDEGAKVAITDDATSSKVKNVESEEAVVSLPLEDATADSSKPITTQKGSAGEDAKTSAPAWWNEQKRPKKKFLGLFPRKNDESGGGAAYVPSRSADLVTPAMTISSNVEESAPAWWTAQKKKQNSGNKTRKW